MATLSVNGVELFYQRSGESGEPLVLVHGSWVDHHSFDFAVPALARGCQVVTYDRRGHSQSERPAGQGSIDEDVADLAALIEALDLAPAHVAGISFGASISLRFAIARPDLIRTVSAQEPPLVALLADDPKTRPLMDAFIVSQQGVLARLRAGDMEGGARQFVDEIAVGPGWWEQLPEGLQRLLVHNAPTFLDEMNDPDALTIDLDRLRTVSTATMLSCGDQSPPLFAPILDKIAEVMPGAYRHTFVGAGHNPVATHAEDYAATLLSFMTPVHTL